MKRINSKMNKVKRDLANDKYRKRTERLAEMGELAAKIAHEIRNPLGSIELYASLLQRELDDPKTIKMADRIVSGVKNLNSVVSNLLYYTKAPRPNVKAILLNAFMDELAEFVSFMTAPKSIIVEKEYAQSEILVEGDEELLKQVFLNLAHNSVQAMESGGILKITTGIEKNRKVYSTQKRDYGFFIVSDTGTGISKGALKRIFNPFFTTRDRGTGLGLSIVHNILDSLEGEIEVSSALEKGSSFKVLLKRHEG